MSQPTRILVMLFLAAMYTAGLVACAVAPVKKSLNVTFHPESIREDSPSSGVYVCGIDDDTPDEMGCIDYKAFLLELTKQHATGHAAEI